MMGFNWSLLFTCLTDASQYTVGEMLTQQDVDGHVEAIAYFLKQLSSAEEHYLAIDRKLLGLVYFVKQFCCYLEGIDFEAFADN